MDWMTFTISDIDLATQGWNVEQTAEFLGITPQELLAGIKDTYPKGKLIDGQLRWHPDVMNMFKTMMDTGFVPRICLAQLD